jgi:ABC-type cobalamin/Fe3+-siderophores transport system ATPase subunit
VSDPSPAIRVRELHKRFGETVAVKSLDLDVRRGECFGLLGPNGAGKTTTIEILEGLTPRDSGEVEMLGMRWEEHGDRIPRGWGCSCSRRGPARGRALLCGATRRQSRRFGAAGKGPLRGGLEQTTTAHPPCG